MHKLTIEDDEGKTVVVPLIRDEITVGRQEGNSIRLTERNISRRHARFFRQSGNLFVEDLGSYTGIKVSGTRITAPTMLKDGDLVVIGDYKLTVKSDRPVATKLYGGTAPLVGGEGTKPLPLPGATAGRTAPLGSPGLGTAPLPMAAKGAAASALAPATGPSGTAALPSLAASAEAAPAPSVTAPAPDNTLDAAPTIPVRTLAEQGLAGDAPPPARLIVTATSLAGAEFSLDRPSLVIGRTPENDIVLNHKSISRHHAKIIRDGEKYIVVDLESANGVRVNGSEFERVELQSGDTLELGHVRMKFTAGNEFVDFEVSSAGANKRRLLIGGAIGAVAVAGLVLSLASGGGSTPAPVAQVPAAQAPAATPPPAPPPPAPAEPVAAVPATPPPAVPAEAATPPPPAPTLDDPALQKLLADAKALLGRRKWDDAAVKVEQIEAKVPGAAELVPLRQTIEAEKLAMDKFLKLEEAGKTRDYDAAVQLFGEIPDTSIYKARALALKDKVAKSFVTARLTEIEQFTNRGECEEARHEAERVLAIEPANERAKALPDRCDRLAAQKAQREADRAAAKEAAAAAAAASPPVVAAPRPAPAAAPTRTPVAPAATLPKPPAPEPRAAAPRPIAEPRPVAARPAPEPRAAAAPPPETGDPEALLQDAQQAWLRGQYSAAIESARRALRVRPNLPKAYQIIAVCSCSLRDADGATKAYERLDERMKPLVKSACQKSGVTLN